MQRDMQCNYARLAGNRNGNSEFRIQHSVETAGKRKTCDKGAEKQSRKTFATMMKNVLCGLKPICAKHRVATSLQRESWVSGDSGESRRKCQIKVATKFGDKRLKGNCQEPPRIMRRVSFLPSSLKVPPIKPIKSALKKGPSNLINAWKPTGTRS